MAYQNPFLQGLGREFNLVHLDIVQENTISDTAWHGNSLQSIAVIGTFCQ
jgi:hypothetical protein